MASNQQPAKPLKQLEKKRQYQSIWENIKKVEPGKVVQVKCHYTAVDRIIQAVRKEKSKDFGLKKKIGLHQSGPLVIEVLGTDSKFAELPADQRIINFSLSWDGSKL